MKAHSPAVVSRDPTNPRILKISIPLKAIKFDFAKVIVLQAGQLAEMKACSRGRLTNEACYITGGGSVEIVAKLPSDESEAECVVGYFVKERTIGQENIYLNVDSSALLSQDDPCDGIVSIPITGVDMRDRLAKAYQRIADCPSPWKLDLRLKEQSICATVASSGKSKVKVAYSNVAGDLMSSDLVFYLYPEISHFQIPMDIAEKTGSSQAVYQIVRVIFPETSKYLKRQISNTVTLNR
jgi:hypothetical protein